MLNSFKSGIGDFNNLRQRYWTFAGIPLNIDELKPLNSFKLSYEPVVIPKSLIDKKLTITRKIDTSQSTLTISDYVQTQTNSPSCSEGKIQSLIHLVPDAKIITKNPETFDKPNIDSKSQMPKSLDIEFKGQ